MTSDASRLQLRDIHLPEPISWWPPATGWWLLAALAVLLLAAMVLLLTYRRRTRLKRDAQAELRQIQDQYRQHQNDSLTIRQLSTLLRRVAISCDGRKQVASLTGTAWLQYLDQLGGGTQFTAGAGRMLVEAPYRRQTENCAAELLEICQGWLNNLRSHGQR